MGLEEFKSLESLGLAVKDTVTTFQVPTHLSPVIRLMKVKVAIS